MEPIRVSQLVYLLRDMLEGSELLSDLWVTGEVADSVRSRPGHRYFSLRDGEGMLRAVLFRDDMPDAEVPNGERILAHGRVSVYPRRGELQFVCDFVRPEGVGIEAARLEQLRERLEREGLFEPSRKRPLPAYPRRIGVVTSTSGAAIRDVRDVLARRWPLAELVVAPAFVQGEQAPASIVAALRALAADETLDLALVVRGGGAAGDLAAFNDEGVVRAVFGTPTPAACSSARSSRSPRRSTRPARCSIATARISTPSPGASAPPISASTPCTSTCTRPSRRRMAAADRAPARWS